MASNNATSQSSNGNTAHSATSSNGVGNMRRRMSDVPSATTRRRRSILGLGDAAETCDVKMSNTVGSAPYPSGMPGSPCPNKLDRRNQQLAIAARRHSMADVHPEDSPTSLSYFTLTNRSRSEAVL